MEDFSFLGVLEAQPLKQRRTTKARAKRESRAQSPRLKSAVTKPTEGQSPPQELASLGLPPAEEFSAQDSNSDNRRLPALAAYSAEAVCSEE